MIDSTRIPKLTKPENHFLTTKLTKYTKLLRISLVFKHHSWVHEECSVGTQFFVCFVYIVVSTSEFGFKISRGVLNKLSKTLCLHRVKQRLASVC